MLRRFHTKRVKWSKGRQLKKRLGRGVGVTIRDPHPPDLNPNSPNSDPNSPDFSNPHFSNPNFPNPNPNFPEPNSPDLNSPRLQSPDLPLFLTRRLHCTRFASNGLRVKLSPCQVACVKFFRVKLSCSAFC